MKNRFTMLPVALGLLLASPMSLASHDGTWHADTITGQSSEDSCQVEAHSQAWDFVQALLHELFHEHH